MPTPRLLLLLPLLLLLLLLHACVPAGCWPRPRGPRGTLGPSEGTPGPPLEEERPLEETPKRRDTKRQIYSADGADCVFRRLCPFLMRRQDSLMGGLGGPKDQDPRGPAESPALGPGVPPGAVLGPRLKRRRRSEDVNPSDPLRSQDHKEPDPAGPPDQDQAAGAVSKETITSCDDPLRVLQPNGPGSPVKTNIGDRDQQD